VFLFSGFPDPVLPVEGCVVAGLFPAVLSPAGLSVEFVVFAEFPVLGCFASFACPVVDSLLSELVAPSAVLPSVEFDDETPAVCEAFAFYV